MMTVLHIARDLSLLTSRTGVLERSGFRVMAAEGIASAWGPIACGPLQCVILCHSVDPAERREIVALVRRYQPAAMVFLVGRGSSVEEKGRHIDGLLETHPHAMIEGLRQALLPEERIPEAAVPLPAWSGSH